MSKTAAAHDAHRPNVKLYVAVFGALMACTFLTVFVSKLHMARPQAIAVGVTIALVKAGLVGAIFMHLWGEKRHIHKVLFFVGFLAAMLAFVVADFVLLSPQLMDRPDVAAQHPDEGGRR